MFLSFLARVTGSLGCRHLLLACEHVYAGAVKDTNRDALDVGTVLKGNAAVEFHGAILAGNRGHRLTRGYPVVPIIIGDVRHNFEVVGFSGGKALAGSCCRYLDLSHTRLELARCVRVKAGGVPLVAECAPQGG